MGAPFRWAQQPPMNPHGSRALWARWKSLDETLKNPEMKGMTI